MDHPSKEEVRAWMARRCHARVPPPPPDEIRRELGWHLPPRVEPVKTPAFVLPAVMVELAALMTVTWCLLAMQQSLEKHR